MGYSALPTTTVIPVVLALILGITAHVLKKNHVLAAVMLFISACLTISFSFLASLLFLLNGIFALINGRQSLPVPYPLYPLSPCGPQAVLPYSYPSYGTQTVTPPQYPAYGAYPAQAAPAPAVNNNRRNHDMRKASLAVGIVGCVIALIAAGIYTAIVFMPDALFPFFSPYGFSDSSIFGSLSGLWAATAICAALAMILGITACVLLKKKHVPAAVLFFVAALLTVLASFLVTLLFILSGIFALVKGRQPLPAPYPPGWAVAYPPYGAYPPPPQQPPYPPYPPYGTHAAPQYPYPPYGAQAAPPYPYPPYGMQAVPPPQYPAYGAYPPQAAQAPTVNNIKEEP